MKLLLTRSLVAGLLTVSVVAVSTDQASAAGGRSIAAAPTVVFGQQEFGNTSTGHTPSTTGREYWGMSVAAGDRITIDWEAQQDTKLDVFPVGTTDYNVESTVADQTQYLSGNGKNELTFIVPKSGNTPLSFTEGCYCPGPYDFTVFVAHGVRLGVPTLGRLPSSGTVPVGVHTPDGAGITDPALSVVLQVFAAGQPWVTVGGASASNAVANIAYTLPASLSGRKARMRAVATGRGYTTAVSNTQVVSVAGAAAPPRLSLGLPRLSRLGRRAVLRVRLRSSDGAVVTGPRVYAALRYAGRWHVVGSASATDSVARIRLNASRRLRGKRVRLRAVVGSGNYPRAASPSELVRIR